MSHKDNADTNFNELMSNFASFSTEMNNIKLAFKEIKDDFKADSIRNDERLNNLQKTNQEALVMLAQLLNIKDEVRKNTEWRLQMERPILEIIESRQLHTKRLWDNIYKYGFIFLAGVFALGITAFIVGK